MILKTFLNMFKTMPKNAFSITIMILTFVSAILFSIDAIYLIICAALLGVLYSYTVLRKETK